jgi:hypothetical protein
MLQNNRQSQFNVIGMFSLTTGEALGVPITTTETNRFCVAFTSLAM